MVTQQAALAEAKQFAEELRQLGIDLRQAILFGSFARNEQRQWSDMGVALVADSFTGFRAEDVRLFVRSLAKHVGIVGGGWEPTAAESRAIPLQ